MARKSCICVAVLCGVLTAAEAFAADGQLQQTTVTNLLNSSNALFLMLGAVMILAMHAGFAFLEAGSVRKKNQVNAFNKIISEWAFSSIVYFMIGYPIARGMSFLGPVSAMADSGGIEYVRFFLLLGFAACIPAIISGKRGQATIFSAPPPPQRVLAIPVSSTPLSHWPNFSRGCCLKRRQEADGRDWSSDASPPCVWTCRESVLRMLVVQMRSACRE